tara:strand:+ start:2140 stop:2349 length:210 start_codon:yes stop_codon:yes gene_type:complete
LDWITPERCRSFTGAQQQLYRSGAGLEQAWIAWTTWSSFAGVMPECCGAFAGVVPECCRLVPGLYQEVF